MAKKKKTALKPAINRGFATTSTPSKKPAESSSSTEQRDRQSEGTTAETKQSIAASKNHNGINEDDNDPLDVLADGLRGTNLNGNSKNEEFDAAREQEQALQNVVDRLRDRVEKDVTRFWKAIEFDRRLSRQLPIFEVDTKVQEQIDTLLEETRGEANKRQRLATIGIGKQDNSNNEDDGGVSDLLEHVQPSSAANELLCKALVTHALLQKLGFTPPQACAALQGCESVTDVDECVAWLVGQLSEQELDNAERRCEGKMVKSDVASSSQEGVQEELFAAVDETSPPKHSGFVFERCSVANLSNMGPGTSGTNTPSNNDANATPTELSDTATGVIEEAKETSKRLLRTLDDHEQIDTLEKPESAYAQARLFLIQTDKISSLLEKQCKGIHDSVSLALAEARRKLQSTKVKARSVIDECQISPRWNKKVADDEFQRVKSSWEATEATIVEKSAVELHSKQDKPTNAMDDILADAQDIGEDTEAKGADFDDESDDGLFGDMLDEQATEVTDNRTQTQVALYELPAQALKSQGIKAPRNVLSDALRRKEPSATLRFEPVATGGRMFRSRLTMRWIKGRIDTFTMTGMATLSQSSADDLMALAALMCVDGKADKNLIGGFREWWNELNDHKQEERDAASRQQYKQILAVLGTRLEAANRDAEESKRLQKAAAAQKATLQNGGQESSTETQQQKDTPAKQRVDEKGKQLVSQRQKSKAYGEMLPGRNGLPIAAYRQHILDTVSGNQVTVLSGETGCGKSTQLPAYIIEDLLQNGTPCKVLVTEPRRISALSLADRVSSEMGEPKGFVGKEESLIGSAVRLENNIGKNARLIYATTGIVLRMLEDGQLDGVTHIIVDEVHERSIESDFLLIILKSLMEVRPELKVVLMSATLDAERFSAYFGGCPTLNVPGRTFPVDVQWLEDAVELCDYTLEDGSPYARKRNHRNADVNNKAKLSITSEDVADLAGDDDDEDQEDQERGTGNVTNRYKPKTISTLDRMDEYAVNHELIVSLLERLCFGPEHLQQYSAATLVFLPGLADIRKLHDILQSHNRFGASSDFQVWPLHSTISSENQQLVFEIPPPGMRKIVLSTNIAETGITIPDITCVIDSGKHREMRFDEKRQMSKLVECFVARSNAKQRRGRAGRVQNGICWHLFTRHRHDSLLAEHPIPEILRLSLQDLALKLKVMKVRIGTSIEDALSKALDAPSSINIQRAVASLVEIKALTVTEDITPLGRQLSRLPLDVYMGKFLLVACSLRVLDSALTIAATVNAKNPFLTPFGRELEARAAKKSFDAGDNDFVAMVRAFNAWRRAMDNGHGRQFVQKCFLSMTNLVQIEELRQQYLTYLLDVGFVQVNDEKERNDIVKARFRFHQGGGGSGNGKPRFVHVPPHLDTYSASLAQVNAALLLSLFPKLLVVDHRNGSLRTLTNNAPASIHPSSVNFKLRMTSLPRGTNHLLYFTIMQSRRLYAWETAVVEMRAVLLLCGEAEFKYSSASTYVDRQRVRVTFYSRKTQLGLALIRKRLLKLIQASFRTSSASAATSSSSSLSRQQWSDEDRRFFELACTFLGVYANDKDRVVV